MIIFIIFIFIFYYLLFKFNFIFLYYLGIVNYLKTIKLNLYIFYLC